MSTTATLSAREDVGLPARLARSAATGAGSGMSVDDFTDWFAYRSLVNRFQVERIPFADLESWSFHPETGNLVHDTGRFFSVEGLHVTVGEGPFPEWQQPII